MIKKILILFLLSTTLIFADESFEEGIDFELINDSPSAYELKENDKIFCNITSVKI